MPRDKLTTLAISMQRQKGVYALLLGSGVSQASSIPTGWAILLRLIKKVALLEKQTIQGKPDDWYRTTYGKEPVYGDLLEMAADTPAERSAIIKEYIEPNDEEREVGLKQPTEAHRAIASLVSDGYIRVIVTTNFDRLLETALSEVGITPSVISSEDGIQGTLPLVHNTCTIIKIHGDYVDARIRNTASELSEYDEGMQRLLRQVFREYGMVISGWSAEWDTALASLLRDEISPWFSTYWVAYSEPKKEAQHIIEARKAAVITHMGAEEFFPRLSESVHALAEHENTELLSLSLAEASLKLYLDDPTKRIRIHDLVLGEAARVVRRMTSGDISDLNVGVSPESVEGRLSEYESATETLRTLFVTGCYWGREDHSRNWVEALERLTSFDRIDRPLYPGWAKLRYYPALQLLYSGGVAALAGGQYETLRRLLYDPKIKEHGDLRPSPMIDRVHCALFDQALSNTIAPRVISNLVLPWRMRGKDWFWVTLKKYIPNEDRRTSLFLEFEYLFGLVHTDTHLQTPYPHLWGPKGSIRRDYDGNHLDAIREKIDTQGASWEPLKAGLFGGSIERLTKAKEQFELTFQRY